jgi:hypothetical protein
MVLLQGTQTRRRRPKSSESETTMSITRNPLVRIAAAGTGVALAVLMSAAPSYAKDGGSTKPGKEVRARNACTTVGKSELRVKPKKGALEVEFKVETKVPGQTYDVSITDNGGTLFAGQRTTASASGEFKVKLTAPDLAGSDAVVGQATLVGGGNSCSSSATTV